MTMRQGWESEARNWANFARTPGSDHSHENINAPVLLELLPGPGARTLDLACGEGRVSRLLRSLGHVTSSDPDARRWQRIPLFLHLRAVKAG